MQPHLLPSPCWNNSFLLLSLVSPARPTKPLHLKTHTTRCKQPCMISPWHSLKPSTPTCWLGLVGPPSKANVSRGSQEYHCLWTESLWEGLAGSIHGSVSGEISRTPHLCATCGANAWHTCTTQLCIRWYVQAVRVTVWGCAILIEIVKWHNLPVMHAPDSCAYNDMCKLYV